LKYLKNIIAILAKSIQGMTKISKAKSKLDVFETSGLDLGYTLQ
jgi:hypothetical protein